MVKVREKKKSPPSNFLVTNKPEAKVFFLLGLTVNTTVTGCRRKDNYSISMDIVSLDFIQCLNNRFQLTRTATPIERPNTHVPVHKKTTIH